MQNTLFTSNWLKSFTFACIAFLTYSVEALPTDEEQLIKIQADSALHSEKSGITRYDGDVILEQGSMKIEAKKIVISSDDQGDIKEVVASGEPAKFQQQPNIGDEMVYAEANEISYNIKNGKIIFTGNAKIKQGQAQLNSDKITYLANQQIFKAEQRKNPKNSKPQRVQIIIPPKKNIQKEL